MEANEQKTITVNIAGRNYPLKVQLTEEVTIRGIVDEINEKINQFQMTYAGRDKQDCLAMALLVYAVDFHKNQMASGDDAMLKRVTQLSNLLDQVSI